MGGQVRLNGRIKPAVGIGVLTWIALAIGTSARSMPSSVPNNCALLGSFTNNRLQILSADQVSAGIFSVGGGSAHKVPNFCRIVGVARPTPRSNIGFELWLPTVWNRRYYQLGNGGFAGNIDHPSLAAEIQRGNAAAMTDTGHKADQFDASWAADNPEGIVDYGHRSIKAVADAARSLITSHYGQPARHRYFVGCSNGGRQALMAAQRYPDDWEGVLAGAPAIEWTRQLASFAATQRRLRSDPANWIPADKLGAIQRAAIASCPPAAVSGGMISDPRLCRFDAEALRCQGADTPDCLTPQQMATLDLIRLGPRDPRSGKPFYYGFEPSSAAIPNNWDQWILNSDARARSQLAFALQANRYLFRVRPEWRIDDFEPMDLARAVDAPVAREKLADVLDPGKPNLSRFAGRGGKLIIYFGWADAVLSPQAGVAYYDEAGGRTGGLARTQRYFRLFMVPGMQHCQGGPAPNAFGQAPIAPALRADPRHDIRLALEEWVERGRQPTAIVAAKYENDQPGGRLVATRQIRAYPRAPAATSFTRNP